MVDKKINWCDTEAAFEHIEDGIQKWDTSNKYVRSCVRDCGTALTKQRFYYNRRGRKESIVGALLMVILLPFLLQALLFKMAFAYRNDINGFEFQNLDEFELRNWIFLFLAFLYSWFIYSGVAFSFTD